LVEGGSCRRGGSLANFCLLLLLLLCHAIKRAEIIGMAVSVTAPLQDVIDRQWQ
jgi:hypothetical protein